MVPGGGVGGDDKDGKGSGKRSFEGKFLGDFGYTTMSDPELKADDVGFTNSVDVDETYDHMLLALKETLESKEPNSARDQVVPVEGGHEVGMAVRRKGKEPIIEPPPPPPRSVLKSDFGTRPRWTEHLNDFLANAVKTLGGPEKATPKGIDSIMNDYGITVHHLKSHLQNYRQHQNPEKTLKQGHKDAGASASQQVPGNNGPGPQANMGVQGLPINMKMEGEKNMLRNWTAHQGDFNVGVQNPSNIVDFQDAQPLSVAPPAQNPFQIFGHPGMGWNNYYGHDFMASATRPAPAPMNMNLNLPVNPFNAYNPMRAVGPNNFQGYMQAYNNGFPFIWDPTEMHPGNFREDPGQASDGTQTSEEDVVDPSLEDDQEDACSSTEDPSYKPIKPGRNAGSA